MFDPKKDAVRIQATYITLRRSAGFCEGAKLLDIQAQTLFDHKQYIAAAYWWTQAIKAFPVTANVVIGKKNNGNDRREAKKAARLAARQTNAATLQMALAGAQKVITEGMPKVDQNAVRAIRAQWEAENKPVVRSPKKAVVTKHGGKQRGGKYQMDKDPRVQMARALVRVMTAA